MRRRNQWQDHFQQFERCFTGWRYPSGNQQEACTQYSRKPELTQIMSTLLSEHKQTGKKRVVNVKGKNASRLLEMGILPGTSIEVVRSAPLGFPIEIKVRGYLLTLRKAEAQCVEIE